MSVLRNSERPGPLTALRRWKGDGEENEDWRKDYSLDTLEVTSRQLDENRGAWKTGNPAYTFTT